MANNSGFPSLTALLGLLAVAGYQNRDRIAEMLRGASASGTPASRQGSQTDSQGLGGILSGVQNVGVGGLLSGGLAELFRKLQQGGLGDAADSWIKPGPNKPAPQESLESALGPDIIEELQEKTGLPREEILRRLARELPDAVDKYTPDGRIPAA